MTRFNSGLVLGTLLVSVMTVAQAADKVMQNEMSQSAFRVKVANAFLSVDAKGAPLVKVFEEIGKQAGIAVEGNIGPAETVTMRFEKVPLEEGIKRLSNNVTIHYADKPNQKGHRITKIVVLAEDQRKGTRTQETKAAKPSKAVEPEPRPEPFKFEFDPTKSMKK